MSNKDLILGGAMFGSSGGSEPTAYLKSAEVVDETLILTKKDGSTVEYSPDFATEDYVDTEIARVEGEIPSLDGYATESYVDDAIEEVEDKIPSIEGLATEDYVDTEVATKSSVSVSSTGTATDEIGYITVDGVEKKIAGGSAPSNMVTTDTDQTIAGTKIFNSAIYANNGIEARVGAVPVTLIKQNDWTTELGNFYSGFTIVSQTRPKYQTSFKTQKLLLEDDIQANPETTTDTLTGITIGDTSYAISGGSGSSYTFTDGLTESDGTVSWDLNDRVKTGSGQYAVRIGNISKSEHASGSSSISFGNSGNGSIQSLAIASIAGGFSEQGSIKASKNSSIALGHSLYNGHIYSEGDTSIAIGYAYGGSTGLGSTEATQKCSVAIGEGVQSLSANQTVIGKANVADSDNTYAFIIGNGTNNSARSNALTVDWSGNLVCNNIPAPPSSDGEYNLHCSIVDGVPTYSWTLQS